MSNTKKYTVKDFFKKYNDAKSDELKGTLIKSVMNVHYVPYETKVTICEKIVESTYYIKTEKNGIKTKKLHINSSANYMLYYLNIVNQYTNIEVDFKNCLEEFNMLNKCGVLDLIINSIPEREFKEFRMILDMVESDVMQNEYEPHAFISNQVERFGELFGSISKPVMKELQKYMKDLDPNDVKAIIGSLKK